MSVGRMEDLMLRVLRLLRLLMLEGRRGVVSWMSWLLLLLSQPMMALRRDRILISLTREGILLSSVGQNRFSRLLTAILLVSLLTQMPC